MGALAVGFGLALPTPLAAATRRVGSGRRASAFQTRRRAPYGAERPVEGGRVPSARGTLDSPLRAATLAGAMLSVMLTIMSFTMR